MVENMAGLAFRQLSVELWKSLRFSKCGISETSELLVLGAGTQGNLFKLSRGVCSLVCPQEPRFQPIVLLRQTC